MTNRPEGRIQLTGLSPDELNLIRDAARWSRLSLRDYVLAQARVTIVEAQKVLDRASGRK